MFGITDLVTFVLGTIFIVLLPGPNSLYVLAASSKLGKNYGYRASLGVVVGDSILMILAATGAATLLHTNDYLFTVFKYAGATYLSYVGLTLLWSAEQKWRQANRVKRKQPVLTQLKKERTISPKSFRTALFISLMNPKAILFFVSFFIQFVDPEYPHPALTFLILGLIVQIFSIAYLVTLIYGGVALAKEFDKSQKAASLFTGATGLVFLTFGVKLVTATL
jgi:leucine efflux protein